MDGRMTGTYKGTIDIIAFAKYVLKKWYFVALAVIAAAAVSIPVMKMTVTPQYISEVKYYLTSSDENISYGTLQVSSSIMDDYMAMIRSRAVAKKAIESSGLEISEDRMLEMISVSNPSKTHILAVQVKSRDRQQAEDAMDALSYQIMEYLPGIMGGSALRLFEEPVTSTDSATNKKLLTAIILVIAFSLASLLGLLLKFMNKRTVETREDITEEFEDINTFLVPNGNRKFLFGSKKKQVRLQSALNSAIEDILLSLAFDKQKSRVIMITSPLSGEGRTFLAEKLYGKLQEEGIEATLVREMNGPLQETIEKLKNPPHLILVDALPVLQSLKTLILAEHCDKIVLAARQDHTTMHDLRKAIYKFRNNGFDVYAVVLNQCKSLKNLT